MNTGEIQNQIKLATAGALALMAKGDWANAVAALVDAAGMVKAAGLVRGNAVPGLRTNTRNGFLVIGGAVSPAHIDLGRHYRSLPVDGALKAAESEAVRVASDGELRALGAAHPEAAAVLNAVAALPVEERRRIVADPFDNEGGGVSAEHRD
jgi:hypothetical protein